MIVRAMETAKSQSYISDTSSQLTDSQMGEKIQHRALFVHKLEEPTQPAMETKNTGIIRIIPFTVIALEFVNVQIQGALSMFT